jgi:hypothetical protein
VLIRSVVRLGDSRTPVFPITKSIYYFVRYRRIKPYDGSHAFAGVFCTLQCVLSTSMRIQPASPRELLPLHTEAYYKACERVGDFLATYTPTFFNMAESHIGPAIFGYELDRSMARLKESLAENILSVLQQVFLPKHNGSGKVKNSDDTSEVIRSSHTFDSHNMNRNLDLHVTKEPTVIECEEPAAMFVEEWRETFVLPSEFHAKTVVDGAEISDASINKTS